MFLFNRLDYRVARSIKKHKPVGVESRSADDSVCCDIPREGGSSGVEGLAPPGPRSAAVKVAAWREARATESSPCDG